MAKYCDVNAVESLDFGPICARIPRISGSFVIARNTASTYKGKSIDVKQVGRELGVRYVLEGSVRRGGDQVRVNVQLVDGESGAHLGQIGSTLVAPTWPRLRTRSPAVSPGL